MRHRFSGRPRRTRSIRVRLSVLLVVPLVSLVALWGYAASVSLGKAVSEQNAQTVDTQTGAASQQLLAQLALERADTYVWLSTDRRAPRSQLDATRTATDAALVHYRVSVAAITGLLSSRVTPEVAALYQNLSPLTTDRAAIDAGTMTALAAFQAYNGFVDSLFQFLHDEIASADLSIDSYVREEGLVDGGRVLEMVGREAGLVGGALASGGRMSPAGHELFVQSVNDHQLLQQEVLVNLGPQYDARFVQLVNSPVYARFTAMENRIVTSSPGSAPIPVSAAAWQSGLLSLTAGFTNADVATAQQLTSDLARSGDSLLTQLLLVGGLGLAAVLVSAFFLLRFVRSIAKELTRLLSAVRTLAEERLPVLVSRLRRGEDVDLAAEAPQVTVRSRTTEVARIADAFAAVQRTAVEAAVGQADLRKGVNKVFRSLARRSQSLLHRQLSMLDSMERRSEEPDALAELFRLDHLTTRMRRHAEGLIILSGAAPGRGWRQPVPIVEVLRGAIGEIEDYTRVDIVTQSRDAVAGNAVADVIHLLAELIENAASYSPPSTRIRVRANPVASGFAVEIEDRGLGIFPAELEVINQHLADPPEFDLADSDRLGLFVVSRLAARHQIRVTLRRSAYGGTTAIVLLPRDIMTPEPDAAIGDGQDQMLAPGAGRRPALPATAPAPDPFPPHWDSVEPADGGALLGLQRRVRQTRVLFTSQHDEWRPGRADAGGAAGPRPSDSDPER